MTQPKGTGDLVNQIANQVNSPPTATPSDADWARFRQALDDADVAKLRRQAADLEIPLKVLPVLLKVRDAHRSATETILTGRGAPGAVERLQGEIQALTASRPGTAEDAQEIGERLAEAQVELRAAEERFRAANYANNGAGALRQAFPQLISDLPVATFDGDSSSGGGLYTVLGDMRESGFAGWDSTKVSWLDHCRKPSEKPRRRARLIAK